MDSESKAPNTKLRHQRELRGWSQKRLADEIDTSKEMVSKWEGGQNPGKYYQEKLCELFGKSAQELGFIREPDQSSSLSSDNSKQNFQENNNLQEKLTQAITQGIMGAVRELGNRDMDNLRRQILEKTIEIVVGGTLISQTPLPIVLSLSVPSITVEEFLPQCAASIKACWHLMRGKELAVAEEILSTAIPPLMKIVAQPSIYQQAAARIASEAWMIRAIIAKHRLNFILREMSCHAAIQCSHIAEDNILQAAALTYLGYTYIFASPLQPKKSVETFQEALKVLGNAAPLLRSDICLGLADAYAQCKETHHAYDYIQQAQDSYPTHPEHDASCLYADIAFDTLYQWEAKTYLSLAVHYSGNEYYLKARHALEQSVKVQAISERCSLETMIYQANVACGLGDLDLYTNALRNGAMMALELGSQLRYKDAFDIYQQTPGKWQNEQKIKELAKDVFL